MWLAVLLFVVGLILLIKGGDWFVDGSVGIARKLMIPEIIIGATIVSLGTTLPEVMASSTSALTGHGEMAYGNAVGSVICNTALIAALTIAIRPSKAERKDLILPVIFFFTASAVFLLCSYMFNYFYRIVGVILLVICAIYMAVTIIKAKKQTKSDDSLPQGKEVKITISKKDLIIFIIKLVLGAACIAVGAKLLIDNGTKIAQELGVPESIIALTFVALGTSLPELITAITALVKGHSALSLGNIIGANLLNLVLVAGLSITLCPFALPASVMVAGINASLLIDLPVMMVVMSILVIPALIKGKLYRWQGILMLIIYSAFCVFQFVI